MSDQDLYAGLIRIHVLYHAKREGVYGMWMIQELRRHGYRVGPGTIYPILHRLRAKRYLSCETKRVAGKVRHYYRITARGQAHLTHVSEKVRELYEELFEDGDHHDG